MLRERDLQGKGPSSILGGGFLFIVETNPIIGKYFNISLLKMAATVYERENCVGVTARDLRPS